MIIAAAIILDLLIGDPVNKFHPVYYIGKSIKSLEAIFIGLGRSSAVKKGLGGLLLLSAVSISLSVAALTMWAGTLIPNGKVMVSVFWIWAVISPRSLKSSARQIAIMIKNGDLQGSRERLSMLVSRDTSALDETDISRATIESVAENSVDGVIAPLVYALIGGPYLALIYRTVNTLDSMVGYKNEKYIDFGWASAKADDLLNFFPARLSRYLFAVSSMILGGRGSDALSKSFAYGKKHDSPNSGIPEASMAGALGLKLGGPAYYFGKLEEREYLGDGRHPRVSDIFRSISVLNVMTQLCLFSFIAWEVAKGW